jgi:hypothetical protein
MQATRRTHGGHWHGQQQAYAPQSSGSHDFPRQRHFDKRGASGYDSYRENRSKHRFRPDTLPQVRYDDDLAMWWAEMDHIVLQYGEEIVCPEILANCFLTGDAIKVWYLGMDSLFRTWMTTEPGCWGRFKTFMKGRFPVGRDGCDVYRVRRPRFRPDSLPQVRYGDDITMWLAEMDNVVLQQGEEIVCPEIMANCFESGDAIKVWYLGLDSLVKTFITTEPGCWGLFKKLMKKRFAVNVGLRQRAAGCRPHEPEQRYRGDRPREPEQRYRCDRPREPEPRYGYRHQDPQPRYGQDLPQGPASSYALLPASSKVMPPASSYAMPPASAKAMPPASSYALLPASSKVMPPASSYAMPPASAKAMPPASSYALLPASSKAMPPAARTAIPTAPAAANVPPTRDTSLAELFQRVDLGIEKALLKFKEEFLREFNNRAGYHHHTRCEEPTTKKYDEELHDENTGMKTDGESNAEKHQEKTTTDEPEQPTRPPDKRLQNSPIPPASSYGMPPKSSNVLYTDPRLPAVQASRRRARTYAGEAELHGTIGSRLYHPQYGEKPLCLTLDVSNENVEKHLEKTTPDEPEQPDESIKMKNDRAFNAEQHHERTRMTNDGEFNAEKHQRLTFAGGTRVPGASNLTRLKKAVIAASNLWFASDRCYEDELRDGIG